jgi:hypothetical protein
MDVHAEADHFNIHVAEGMVLADVARLEEDLLGHLEELANAPRKQAYALLLDLREMAPAINGATSTERWAQLLTAWDRVSRRVALLAAPSQPLLGMQLNRILSKHVRSTWVKVFDESEAAFAWVSGVAA